MLTLRSLSPDDWPLWRTLRLAALADAPYAFNSRLADWNDATEARWRARLATPGGHHLTAHLDDRPVAMASGIPGDPPDTWGLHSLWVAPTARGLGIATHLITAVEAHALAAGATTLHLTVLPGNEPATALYRRIGYTPTTPDGTMAKPLRRP